MFHLQAWNLDFSVLSGSFAQEIDSAAVDMPGLAVRAILNILTLPFYVAKLAKCQNINNKWAVFCSKVILVM